MALTRPRGREPVSKSQHPDFENRDCKRKAAVTEPLWTPSAERIAATRLTAFTKRLADERQVRVDGYDALWRWSVDDRAGFWDAVWDFCGVIGSKGGALVADRK